MFSLFRFQLFRNQWVSFALSFLRINNLSSLASVAVTRNYTIPAKVRLNCTLILLAQYIFKMGKTGGFYAVARGRTVGIYNTWDECKSQVAGFTNARYKKFGSKNEAETFISDNSGARKSDCATEKLSESLGCPDVQISGPSHSTSTFAALTPKAPAWKANYKHNIHQNKPERSVLTRSLGFSAQVSTVSSVAKPQVPQKRDFSTTSGLNKRALKVTEERVINKRPKLSSANQDVDLSDFTVDKDGFVVVYTDGACKGNGKGAAKAGIGIWFGDSHSLNISEPVRGRQTNNTAEIQAAERAILQAKTNGINKLNVQTDSQFTINCVTKWLNNWKRNQWKLKSGGFVKNREDLEKLDRAMDQMDIKWSYVAGHAGHRGNEEADRLAVLGSQNRL